MISAAQAAYLSHYIDGPGYVAPYRVNKNTIYGAQKHGYIEYVEGSRTQVRLTEAGKTALRTWRH